MQPADKILESRERLAELDLQAAEAKRDVAASELDSHQMSEKKVPGSVSRDEMRKLEATLRLAEVEVERAKTKLAGLAKQRAEMEAATIRPQTLRPVDEPVDVQLRVRGEDPDLATRERLAQLDLQAAEEEYAAAETTLPHVRQLFKQGEVPQRVVLESEKDHRHAAIELKRARIKLEGLARQRADLKASAEADVAEAEAELQKADAKVRGSTANWQTAQAQVASAEADLATAKTYYEYRDKQYQRVRKLVEANAVDEKLGDEEENHFAAAKAGIDRAQAALTTAKANADQCISAIDEAKAAREIAHLRVRAAQARRDQLNRHAEPEQSPDAN